MQCLKSRALPPFSARHVDRSSASLPPRAPPLCARDALRHFVATWLTTRRPGDGRHSLNSGVCPWRSPIRRLVVRLLWPRGASLLTESGLDAVVKAAPLRMCFQRPLSVPRRSSHSVGVALGTLCLASSSSLRQRHRLFCFPWRRDLPGMCQSWAKLANRRGFWVACRPVSMGLSLSTVLKKRARSRRKRAGR